MKKFTPLEIARSIVRKQNYFGLISKLLGFLTGFTPTISDAVIAVRFEPFIRHSDPHRFDSLLRMQNESVGGRISLRAGSMKNLKKIITSVPIIFQKSYEKVSFLEN